MDPDPLTRVGTWASDAATLLPDSHAGTTADSHAGTPSPSEEYAPELPCVTQPGDLSRAVTLQSKLPEGSIIVRDFHKSDANWLRKQIYEKSKTLRQRLRSSKYAEEIVRVGAARRAKDETLDTKGFIAFRLDLEGSLPGTRKAHMQYGRIESRKGEGTCQGTGTSKGSAKGTDAYVEYSCQADTEEDRCALMRELTNETCDSARKDKLKVLWIDEPEEGMKRSMRSIGYKEDENGPPDYVYAKGVQASDATWLRLEL